MTCTINVEHYVGKHINPVTSKSAATSAMLTHYNFQQPHEQLSITESTSNQHNHHHHHHHHHHHNSDHLDHQIIRSLQLLRLTPVNVDILKSLCGDWFPVNYPDSWYHAITTNPKYDSFAATVDGQIIAILVSETKSLASVNKEDHHILSADHPLDSTMVTYILSIGVDRSYRRMGVASYMIRELVKHCKAMHDAGLSAPRAIYLHVLCTNHAAIRFYERHGFELLHFLRDYYIIDNEKSSGYSYVRYVNGGRGPLTWYECVQQTFCGFAVVYTTSCSFLGNFIFNLLHRLKSITSKGGRDYRSL